VTDNVDIFKKIIFSIPSTKKLAVLNLVLSTFYASIVVLALQTFSTVQIPDTLPLVLFTAFFTPVFLSGELLYNLIPDYPRRWGYFLALSNSTILFVYLTILTGSDTIITGWRVFWLALATIFITNLLVLLLTLGHKHFKQISLGSIIQPATIFLIAYLYLGNHFQPVEYLSGLLVVGIAGLLVFLTIGMAEYLLKANVADESILHLTAGLLQKKPERLELGKPVKPNVQTIEIENKDENTRLAVPWVHPGPLEGFGGGSITSDIIKKLNTDGEGFYLHVPSTHRSDPCDPEDHKKILDALEKPVKTSKASEMITENYQGVIFHGRKIGDQKIIFMDAEEYGIYEDYEIPIFKDILDLEDTLLVDLHCHSEEQTEREEMRYNTEQSRFLRESLKDFQDKLNSLEQSRYKAGFHTDTSAKPVFALVERVGEQDTLVFGLEGNGISDEVQELAEKYRENYDKVLSFSTDTHQSIHQLSRTEQIDKDKIKQSVDKAEGKTSEAEIGFTKSKAETMKLLQDDYSGLIFSINILTRLMILLLAAVYLWLIGWIFL